MVERKERRATQKPPPTVMLQAVRTLEKWKLNTLFVFGLFGDAIVIYWFAIADRGHEHSIPELLTAGSILAVCSFFAFPVGFTRALDKFWPDKWRSDPRRG